MPSIAGSKVLILGGSSGIGFGVGKHSLAEGARVFISSSNPTRVSNAVNSLKESFPNGDVTGYPCDLSQDDAESRLEDLFSKIGELDHIVFTAGDGLALKPVSEIDIDYIRKAGHVRFTVPLLVAKVGSRYLKKSHTSSYILTGGAVAQKPMPNWSVVASYSSGLNGMVRNLALDLKPIRVNLVIPGAIETELWGPNREALVKQAAAHTALGKVGAPEEVAEAYIYFMKDTNATASSISSNGGSLIV
ncbi:hypothetical protein DTO195F2_6549 [Paecilomyces variotii]|nr:hypothetical protein DTO195F2_6549 [Paecilomyces variotii]KAJ9369545.1 hypothetical protein DTO282E5_5807 [Paecilomyces variotii]